MVSKTICLFDNVEDEQQFAERRFHKSIAFMRSCQTTKQNSDPVKFGVYEVGNTKTYAAVLGSWQSESLMSALNLEPVRVWTLIRRGKDVFFVGESSESIIADNIVPLGILLEGEEDAERCWRRT